MSTIPVWQRLGRLLVQPAEILGDYAREPLRRREHERKEEAAQRQHARDMDKILAEERVRSELNINEQKARADAEVHVTVEVQRALAELEEIRKDKSLARMERASEAMMRFQKDMLHLTANIAEALGNMQLDLRERAQAIMLEKTTEYKCIQDQALKDAADEFVDIEARFSGNEKAKEILYKAVDRKLTNITEACQRFMEELSRDISLINQSISSITESGVKFVEQHLAQFNHAGITPDDVKQIK
ncbi:hypothetical protein E6C67_03035 (plasmid) [Azospirillum sp. TSA2s]|uniref:hypothetical protein n=1 Tax=Azospirillum sp. TSA2s TaxID=709810 RepID=UPI0010AA4F23|nr:hypothetical protein [Azospirillum sp. TSA2s]QCG92940.1 hypothetical protein E6C67_03035 [Azospirillum sp. TSA2s]